MTANQIFELKKLQLQTRENEAERKFREREREYKFREEERERKFREDEAKRQFILKTRRMELEAMRARNAAQVHSNVGDKPREALIESGSEFQLHEETEATDESEMEDAPFEVSSEVLIREENHDPGNEESRRTDFIELLPGAEPEWMVPYQIPPAIRNEARDDIKCYSGESEDENSIPQEVVPSAEKLQASEISRKRKDVIKDEPPVHQQQIQPQFIVMSPREEQQMLVQSGKVEKMADDMPESRRLRRKLKSSEPERLRNILLFDLESEIKKSCKDEFLESNEHSIGKLPREDRYSISRTGDCCKSTSPSFLKRSERFKVSEEEKVCKMKEGESLSKKFDSDNRTSETEDEMNEDMVQNDSKICDREFSAKLDATVKTDVTSDSKNTAKPMPLDFRNFEGREEESENNEFGIMDIPMDDCSSYGINAMDFDVTFRKALKLLRTRTKEADAEFAKLLGISPRFAPHSHPNSHGTVKRFHRTSEAGLRHMIMTRGREWHDNLKIRYRKGAKHKNADALSGTSIA